MNGMVRLTDLWVDTGPMRGLSSASLIVEAELIEVTSIAGRTVPDSRWTHVDTRGHWHAAASRTTAGETSVWYPTLEDHKEPNPEFDPAMADWEEYDEPVWLAWQRCRICHERVDPRTITTHERRFVSGQPQWRIKVEVADPEWFLPGRQSIYTVRGMAPRETPSRAGKPRPTATAGRREWFGVARWYPAGLHDASGEAAMVTGTFEGVSELGERVG